MTTHQSILGLLSWFCHCFGISQWMTSQSRTNEPLFVHFQWGVDWVVLKNEDGGLDPYYYLGHQLQMTTHQSILGLLHGCHCFGISQWMTSQSRTNEPLFVHFNGCGLSGAEKWGCGLDPYYYLGHSASNDHPPVNSWTSFMVLSLLWNLPMNDKSI